MARIDHSEMTTRFKDVFTGIAKLKDSQLKLHSLKEKIEKKLHELLREDISEQVGAVPKPNGDVRLCLDMRIIIFMFVLYDKIC